MASANTIAALAAGAECASVTINGLGERAGNASLEEVVMAARMTLGLDCGIDTRQLAMLSDLVAEASSRPLRPDKPIVGAAVFRHESGIHCSGLLAHQRTYEPFAAEEVGHAPTELVLGHHSGTGLLGRRLEQLKLIVPRHALPALLEEVRRFAADRKSTLTDADLQGLIDTFRTRDAGLQASANTP